MLSGRLSRKVKNSLGLTVFAVKYVEGVNNYYYRHIYVL